MTIFEIIHTSKDRVEAIARLVATGMSRQEAKMYTFGWNAIAGMKGTKTK